MNSIGAIGARLLRFVLVGIMTNLAGLALFILLFRLDFAPTVASGITYMMAVAAGYASNRIWSFKSTASHKEDLPRYLGAYAVGLVVAMTGMWALTKFISPVLAQVLVIAMTSVVVFMCLQLAKFGRKFG